jgi:YVTN family beta-propeller protein
MSQFLLGVLKLASIFSLVSRAHAKRGGVSGLGVRMAAIRGCARWAALSLALALLLPAAANAQNAYIANSADNTVSVIDTASNTVTSTIPVGTYPLGVAVTPDGAKAYITNNGSGTVSAIATATNTIVATIPVGQNPYGIAITPDGAKAYVANYSSNTVSVIDTATNTVIATIPSVVTAPLLVAITPDGAKVYVTHNTPPGTVAVINTATNTVVATIPVGQGPWGVAVTPDGAKVYVDNAADNTVSVIATASGTVIATIPVGTLPYGVAVTPDGTKVYITNADSTVSVITTATNTVVATIPRVGTFVLYGVAVTPDGTKVYAVNSGGGDPNPGTVSVINTATDTVVTTIPVGFMAISFGKFIGGPVSACQPITTLQDLRNMGTAGHYCLANDIDASSTSTNPFTPIGNDGSPFAGVFDGNGHVIDKLTIGSIAFNGPCCAPSLSGLFGSIGTSGIVRDVGITNATISYQSYGGILAGENNGVVTNSFVTGAVTSQWLAGGLIAWNKGQISNSHAMVFVQAGSGSKTGGFVGVNDTSGLITQSYASGQVSPVSGTQDIRSGGFVGENDGTITKSYATGGVTGPGFYGHVGGFVGDNSGGTIGQSYATGSVTGNGGIAGGFAGGNYFAAISQSYSTGLVTGGLGFVDFDYQGKGVYASDYWDVQTSGQTIDAAPAGTTGLTTTQLKAGLPSGFDPTVWGIVPSLTYPYLLWQIIPPVAVNESAATTANTPVTINLAAGASGNPTSAALVGTPVGGTVTGFPATKVTFTPAAGFSGTASFQFTLANASGTPSNTATATITVTPPPPPVAVDETASTTAGVPVTIDLSAGASGTPTSAAIISSPAHGTLGAISGTQVTYTPNSCFASTDRFTFTLANAFGTSNNVATATITVTGPPVAANETTTTIETTPVEIDLSFDACGSPTSAAQVGTAVGGMVKGFTATTVTFKANTGFTGVASFQFTLANASGTPSNTATATINVIKSTRPFGVKTVSSHVGYIAPSSTCSESAAVAVSRPMPSVPIAKDALKRVKERLSPASFAVEVTNLVTATARPPGINPAACPTNKAAGYKPSDSHAAAGLTNLVVTTNNDIGIYRKSDCGCTNFAPLTTFFRPAGATDTIPLCDSRVLFDRTTNRYFVTTTSCTPENNRSYQYFAVSQDSSGASWWMYQVVLSDGNQSFCKQAPDSLWDYPQAGSDFNRWFIDANDQGAANMSDILSIDKVSTLTGAPTAVACFPALQINVAPPIVLDSDPGAVHISPGWFGGSTIKRYRIDTSALNPASDKLKTLNKDTNIPSWLASTSAEQPNTFTLDTQDGRFQSASIQSGGQLWNVHSVRINGKPLVRLYKFSTDPKITSVPPSAYVTLETTNGNDSLFNASVVTAGGANSPIFVTASRTIPSSKDVTGYAAHVVLSNPGGILLSGWQFDVLATSSVPFKQCTTTTGEPIVPFSWGDYSATTIDPLMNGRAWSINQIAMGPSCSTWATETGAVDITPPASSAARK